MNSKKYEIYEIENYKGKRNKKICDSLPNICNILTTQNKGYHLNYYNNEIVILFGDIDNIPDEKIFKKILKALSSFFSILKQDICYTLSIKENSIFSYHWSFNGLCATIEQLGIYMTIFNNEYPEFNKYIDMSIYNNNRLFRLPFQTNSNKSISHIIKVGCMEDFIISYIPIGCELMEILKPVVKNKVINTEDDNNKGKEFSKEYIELFNNLNLNKIDTRDKWVKLGALIYSIYDNDGFNLFLDLSKKIQNFKNIEDVKTTYNSFKYKSYSINTLYYKVKQDNPQEFDKIIKKINGNKILSEVLLNNTIEINKRYLLDIGENLNSDSILIRNLNEFINNSDIKSFNLKSPYDTGKTQLLKLIVPIFKRILWISYRVSLTNDIKGNFKNLGFKSYQDGEYNADKLIIQLESVIKLDKNNDGFIDEFNKIVPQYDLIIIDEVESVLNQFDSPTFKGYNKETFEYLEEIILNSKKVITLDGDLSNRTYNYINYFGNSINIINNVQVNKMHFDIIDDEAEYMKQIYKELDNNNKIVIVSQSRTFPENIKKDLNEKYPNLNILLYTSFTSGHEKRLLENVNDIWINADVLLYSPTIEAGVNFDLSHFNKKFGILSNLSTSPRSFLQMLARVRKVTDTNITILNDINFKLNEITNFINIDDEKEALKELNIFKMETTYKTIDNQRVKTQRYSNYVTNYLYNNVEASNKKPYYFLCCFKNLVISKGHTFNYIKNDKQKKRMGTNEIYEQILNCKLITRSQYEMINIKKNIGESTYNDNILWFKFYFCRMLGLDELNIDLIKTFYNKFYLLNNFISIIDIDNYKTTSEADNIKHLEKLRLIKDMILNLGFNNIFDKKNKINADELITNFKNIYKNNKIFTHQKMAKLSFNIAYFKYTDETTIKKLLGHLNTILLNYSLKIVSIRKRIGDNNRIHIYGIEILNNIDEIFKYKTLKGFKLVDKNNIFKCDETKLKDLFISKIDNEDEDSDEESDTEKTTKSLNSMDEDDEDEDDINLCSCNICVLKKAKILSEIEI